MFFIPGGEWRATALAPGPAAADAPPVRHCCEGAQR